MNLNEIREQYQEKRKEITEKANTPAAVVVFALLAFGVGMYFVWTQPKPKYATQEETVTLKTVFSDSQAQIELAKKYLNRDKTKTSLTQTVYQTGILKPCGFKIPEGWDEINTTNPKILIMSPKNKSSILFMVQPVAASTIEIAWQTVYGSEVNHKILQRHSGNFGTDTLQGVLTDLIVPGVTGNSFSQRRIYVLKKINISGRPCIFWGTLLIDQPEKLHPEELSYYSIAKVADFMKPLRSPFQIDQP